MLGPGVIVVVLGGTRSGKSEVAERIAAELGEPVTYVATAVAGVANEAGVTVGWLIAVNPPDDRGFGPDVELLTTVAGLIATQRGRAALSSSANPRKPRQRLATSSDRRGAA